MCGILSYFEINNSVNNDSLFSNALNTLYHRGPNDFGSKKINLKTGILYLGHTRLSIIDLTSNGHQPMVSICNRFIITYNGEIYNYKELRNNLKSLGFTFHTDSDTEVLLNAWSYWGTKCLNYLRGMFAFCVYDNLENTITIVRDPFGIKPLYYSWNGEKFIVSSELDSIKLISPNLKENESVITEYLVDGRYDCQEHTFYKDVYHLMPSSFLKFNLNSLQIIEKVRWWFPSISQSNIKYNDAVEKLRYLFLESVNMHMRSDVPIGATLSGGIDSSSIVCAMRYLEPDMDIHTFSYVASDSVVNENYWIDEVNNFVNARPNKIYIDSNDLLTELEKLVSAQGEPFAGTSIYAQFKVFECINKFGIKVILDGQGADELLAGYDGYPNYFIQSLFNNKKYIYLIKYLYNWSNWPGRNSRRLSFLKDIIIPRNYINKLKNGLIKNKQYTYFNKDFKLKYSNHQSLKNYSESNLIQNSRTLMYQLREELTRSGISKLLRHADRNSMYWSIENRVPFLNTDLVEFVFSLPETFLVSNEGETKYIFRDAMSGIVPESVLRRRDKIGFETPEASWFSKERIFINNTIREKSNNLNYLNSDIFNDKFDFIKSNIDNRFLWRLMNYILWQKTN